MTGGGGRAGVLVAIEGIDGVGKSTLQRALAARLRREGFVVGLWHEPTDARLGHRAQLAGTSDPWTAAMFFTLDRALARPRLERLITRSDVVLADRSFYSTLAYQGSALPSQERVGLARLERTVTLRPDRVLWLRLSPREALHRVRRRGEQRAPLERRRTLERVARSYRRLARPPAWIALDARASPEETAGIAWRSLTRLLRRRRRRPARRG